MNERDKNKIYVVGHKNPDTDSICSAIAYAALKTKITGKVYEPRRAGQLNEETQYVLERFHVKTPRLLSDLREQIKDVELKEVEGIRSSVSIRTAWEKMQESNIHTLPVTRDGKLEGVITIGDIAKTYMEVYDNTILSKARTVQKYCEGCGRRDHYRKRTWISAERKGCDRRIQQDPDVGFY